MMKWFWDAYTKNEAQRNEIYASPLRASTAQLKGLPPALIQVAQFDVLRDEGEAYGRKLDAAGVDATTTRYDGTIHDFGLLNALATDAPTKAATKAMANEIATRLAEVSGGTRAALDAVRVKIGGGQMPVHAASAPPTIPRRYGAAARGPAHAAGTPSPRAACRSAPAVQQHEPAVLQPAGPSRVVSPVISIAGIAVLYSSRMRAIAAMPFWSPCRCRSQISRVGRTSRCQARDRVIDRRGRDDLVAPALEQHRHAGADRAFVVDHDHEVRGGRRLVDGDLVGGGARLHRVQPHQLQFEA